MINTLNTYPIYPEVDIRESNGGGCDSQMKQIGFATSIRKKHKGKYYFWDVMKKRVCDPRDYDRHKIAFLKSMYAECYNVIVLGVVTPKLQSMYGNVYKVDNSNISEQERLTSLLPKI